MHSCGALFIQINVSYLFTFSHVLFHIQQLKCFKLLHIPGFNLVICIGFNSWNKELNVSIWPLKPAAAQLFVLMLMMGPLLFVSFKKMIVAK